MGRRWVFSNGENAKQVNTAKIAIGGFVRTITGAVVADGGVFRQFHPFAGGSTDERIIFNSTPITVTKRAEDPNTAEAQIIFERDNGTYSYDNDPNASVIAPYLNPPVTGATQYLIMAHQVSGTAITGTLDSWIDLFSAAEHKWYLQQAGIGEASANVEISIAEDTGAGEPRISTMVVKSVSFVAGVKASTDIVWSQEQRDLVEITESVDADCALTFNPTGSASGYADTSGAFTEAWHIDSPLTVDGNLFTVQVDVVSGTPPVGTSLGIPLDLSTIREWILTATTGENLSNVLNVTVDDLVPAGNEVAKKVTMNSQRGTPVEDPIWTTDPWTGTDAGYPQGLGLDVEVYLEFNIDGTSTLSMESQSLPLTEFGAEDWFDTPSAPDLNNYEVKIDYVSGAGIAPPYLFNTWYRMTETRLFNVMYATKTIQKVYQLTGSVRKVGGLSIDKPITITIIADSGETP